MLQANFGDVMSNVATDPAVQAAALHVLEAANTEVAALQALHASDTETPALVRATCLASFYSEIEFEEQFLIQKPEYERITRLLSCMI